MRKSEGAENGEITKRKESKILKVSVVMDKSWTDRWVRVDFAMVEQLVNSVEGGILKCHVSVSSSSCGDWMGTQLGTAMILRKAC